MKTLRLLNRSEEETRERLTRATVANEVEVCAKVRVADALPINGSGIESELFSYALQAHFDFVVTSKEWVPLFAVEFDGPTHEGDPETIRRDDLKHAICDRLDFPLARVRREHVFSEGDGLNYVTWLVELFFAGQVIARAHEDGTLPPDEPGDPMMFMSHPVLPGQLPLWLGRRALLEIMEHHRHGDVGAEVPMILSAYDKRGYTLGLGILPSADGSKALMTGALLYLARFGVTGGEVVDQLLVSDLATKVTRHLAGEVDASSSWAVTAQAIIRLLKRSRPSMLSFLGSSGGPKFGFTVALSGGEYTVTWGNQREVIRV